MKQLLILLVFVAGIAAKEARYTVGFAQDTMANDWRIAQVKEVEAAFKAYPEVTFVYTDGKGETARQIRDIEDLVARGIDLLITSPMDAVAMAPVIEKVYKSGIPVILLTRSIQSESYTVFIHPDDRKIAGKAANFLVEKLGGKGEVLMLTGVPTASTAVKRSEGFLEVAGKHPGIRVTRAVGNYLRADAINAVEMQLNKGVRFDAIFSQSDSMAVGAIMALQKHGIDPAKKLIVGIDYISQSRELIKEGLLDATFRYPTGGAEGVAAAIKILRGGKVPREIVIDSVMVTPENAARVAPVF